MKAKRASLPSATSLLSEAQNCQMQTPLQILSSLRLHDGEGTIDTYPEDNIELDGVTHIISSTFDFPEYNAATDAMIPTVKPVWVDHSLAKDKLINPRQYSPDPRLFMADIVACCTGLPEGDADAIAGGILAMGGLFATKLTSQVTHIVALTTEADLCEVALKRRLGVKIVLPHWFDDCLRLGRKIDEQPYLLPDPEILRPPQSKPPTGIQKGNVTGAVNPDPSALPPSTPSEIRSGQKVFKNKQIMLGKDLGIGSHLRGILEGIVIGSGGGITQSIKKCHMFICKYREGEDYRVASRSGKDVGNLAWLYYLITTDKWTSPLRRLLHYPIVRTGLPGFHGFKISLSNYSGEARTYLENLVLATGAECTKTLKQDNTHLLTAHDRSEKCDAAKDWGVHLVNHLWLEESYALWKLQSVSNSRYTHFPSRTNLGEVVGHTQINREVLEQCFFAGEDVDLTNSPPQNGPTKRIAQNLVDRTGHAEVESRTTNNPRSRPSDHKTSSTPYRTPIASRFVAMGKENITPSTTGSRKSKDVATAKMHDLSTDIALYEKERKRVGGVVYGGRRKNDEDRVVATRKRSVEAESDTEAAEEADAKRARTGLPPPTMHLMISSYKKWVGHSKDEENDKKHLRSLGIVITQDPSRASHLAAPHIVRTQKFVTAIAYAPAIISTDFIDACLEEDELVDPDEFQLEDAANEKKLGVSLSLSRQRATENRNELLLGRCVYCVENIHGGFETYKSIVEANGGQCMLWRNRKGTLVPSRRADSEMTTDDEMQNEVYLLSGPNKENEKLWHKFRQMAEGSRKIPRIVIADWLLETAMCQKLLPTGKFELREDL